MQNLITKNVSEQEIRSKKEAIDAAWSTGSGGGIFINGIEKDTVVTLKENRIIENSAVRDGGGIEIIGEFGTDLDDLLNLLMGKPPDLLGGPKVTSIGNLIKGNKALHDGGGLSVVLLGETSLQNDRIIGNHALLQDGGGLHNTFLARVTVQGCTFYSNKANRRGGAIYKRDGGYLKVAESVLNYNNAIYSGGAIFVHRVVLTGPAEAGNREITKVYIEKDNRIIENWIGKDAFSTLAEGAAIAIVGDVKEGKRIQLEIKDNKEIAKNRLHGKQGDERIDGIVVPKGSAVFIYDAEPKALGRSIFEGNTLSRNYGFGLKVRQTVKDKLKFDFVGNDFGKNHAGAAFINIGDLVGKGNRFHYNKPEGEKGDDRAWAEFLQIHGGCRLIDNWFRGNQPVQIRVDGKAKAFFLSTDVIAGMGTWGRKRQRIGMLVTQDAKATITYSNIYVHRKPRKKVKLEPLTQAGLIWKRKETMDATRCWWGDPLGPWSDDNPEGREKGTRGERVIGKVKDKTVCRRAYY